MRKIQFSIDVAYLFSTLEDAGAIYPSFYRFQTSKPSLEIVIDLSAM